MQQPYELDDENYEQVPWVRLGMFAIIIWVAVWIITK